MMRILFIAVLFLMLPMSGVSQKKASKGDNYFFEYKYNEAIAAYAKESSKRALTPLQELNLADAYFKTGNYQKATDLYLKIHKMDTVMSVARFNTMLQSLSKVDGRERIRTFLNTPSDSLSTELLENANFNYELLDDQAADAQLRVSAVSVNSPQNDFSPSFYKDHMLFSSSRPRDGKEVYAPTGQSYLNIYEAQPRPGGDVSKAVPFSKLPASKYHKATPYYSEELNRVFYVLSNTIDGEMAYDVNGKNALAIGMGGIVGSFRFLLKDLSTSFYYPFYEAATGRLYFAADFEEGYGGTDLYYVKTNNGQIMSAPINLGPRINSPGNEIAPYLYDGSLYFSSDVFYGLGGMDVYKTNTRADGSYSIPVNLGLGINSRADDFGFIIRDSPSGLEGYVASNRKGGKGGDDLYYFSTTGTLGLKTFSISGRAMNKKTNNAVAEVLVALRQKDSTVIKEVLTNAEGRYTMEIPWQDSLMVTARKDGFSKYSGVFGADVLASLEQQAFPIALVRYEDLLAEAEGKKVIALKKFYFDKGKSAITPLIATELEKVVFAVKNFPEVTLAIESHTDSRGSGYYNKRLSQRRADAIKTYLMSKGVPENSIVSATGYGEEKITNNCVNGAYCLDFLHKQNERNLIVVEALPPTSGASE